MTEADVDIAVIVAYGRILRSETLAAVPMGYVNVHLSLLPRWRGAAPVERAILAGDERTGVTLMVLDEGMDTGPLLAAHETEIDNDETGGSLTARLAHDGAVMLADVLPGYARGRVKPAPQMASGATSAPRLTSAEAQVTAATPADVGARMVRAFAPRPGAWAMVDGIRTKLWHAQPSDVEVPRGHLALIDDEPHLGLVGGAIALRSVQPAGKRVMTGREWAAGRRGRPARLDDA
jgi:methionyl-tRNA formyltransferase